MHYTNIPLERLIAVERLARELVEMCNASNALFTPVSQEILKELPQAGEARNELEIVLLLAVCSLTPYHDKALRFTPRFRNASTTNVSERVRRTIAELRKLENFNLVFDSLKFGKK